MKSSLNNWHSAKPPSLVWLFNASRVGPGEHFGPPELHNCALYSRLCVSDGRATSLFRNSPPQEMCFWLTEWVRSSCEPHGVLRVSAAPCRKREGGNVALSTCRVNPGVLQTYSDLVFLLVEWGWICSLHGAVVMIKCICKELSKMHGCGQKNVHFPL